MRTVFTCFASIAVIITVACGAAPTPPPDPPPLNYVPVADGGGSDAAVENSSEALTDCGKACANLRKFNCAEGLVTSGGSRCYDVCKSAGSLINASCVAKATTLDVLKACSVRCLPN